LETTRGLPVVRVVSIADEDQTMPLLREIVLHVDGAVGILGTSAVSIDVTFSPLDAEVAATQNFARALSLNRVLPASVSATFEDQAPVYTLFLQDVAEDFTIDASPSLPQVERFSWAKTVPANLGVLQQFGTPSLHANFLLLADETYPLIVDYVAWLREEAPNTKIGLNDEIGTPLELSDIGVTE
jgi:hypothetical protein